MQSDKVIPSEDGSHTLLSEKFNVTYHSKFGAIDESMTIFIQAGYHYFDPVPKSPIKIFEMGFGTGLNPLLTLKESLTDHKEIIYTGIEAYPVSKETLAELNYIDILGKEYKNFLDQMHGEDVHANITDLTLTDKFSFNKLIGDIEKMPLKGRYDLIYYDAFGPGTQPTLWEEGILEKMFKILDHEGILVTYCAKGSFKRALKKVGFDVENLPGPKGKREITRAIKK